MDPREPQLTEAKVSGPTLPTLVGGVVAVGVLAFAFGASLGRMPSPSPSPSAVPAASPLPIREAEVSPELWSAYLSGANSGWALCTIEVAISCTPLTSQPSLRFKDFSAMPFSTSQADWTLLAPSDIVPDHYVIAGPITLTEPQLVLALVSDDGVATIQPASPQTRWNGHLWADLGELETGRYLVITQGLTVGQPDPEGRYTTQLAGFASAFIVLPGPSSSPDARATYAQRSFPSARQGAARTSRSGSVSRSAATVAPTASRTTGAARATASAGVMSRP